MEIKQGDKVRVAKDIPMFYRRYNSYRVFEVEHQVVDIEDGIALLDSIPSKYVTTIPTKYLVKVDAEAKPKFRVGDWVKIKHVTAASLHELPDVYKNCPFKITAINGSMITAEGHEHSIYLPFHAFEPTEQSEEEERQEEFFKKQTESTLKSGEYFRKQTALAMTMNDFMESPFKMIPRTMFNTEFWVKYEADLAKEVALKVANKFNDPEQAAEYAVKVAKAVVEGLKRK